MSNNHMAVIAAATNVRIHPGADRLKLATCLGNQIVVGLDTEEGMIGVYFNCDLQLSEAYATANDLVRRKDDSGNNVGGMFCDKRRVRAQKLRGEISDGYFAHLESVSLATGVSISDMQNLSVGSGFDQLNGVNICNKYVTERTSRLMSNNNVAKKTDTSVMFHKHIDTDQFGRNSELVLKDDKGTHVVCTLKMHGTSARVGHVQLERKLTLRDKIAGLFGITVEKYRWTYLIGSRNVVMANKTEAMVLASDEFRDRAARPFIRNLRKGETVFYEVVGYENGSKTIMNTVDTSSIKDKELKKLYRREDGSTKMVFSYGCKEGEFDTYVYRITNTSVDGESVDLSWAAVEQRCNEMGVKTVPTIFKETVNAANYDDFIKRVQDHTDGKDLVDPNHVREGVCLRLENGTTPKILKNKSFVFKILEGLVKDTGEEDMEESA